MRELEEVFNELNVENQEKVIMLAKGIEIGQNGVTREVKVESII